MSYSFADIDRKIEEINAAETTLLSIYEKHGEFRVCWDGKARKKSIRVKSSWLLGIEANVFNILVILASNSAAGTILSSLALTKAAIAAV
nr:hypothetical protein [Nostoc commune]